MIAKSRIQLPKCLMSADEFRDLNREYPNPYTQALAHTDVDTWVKEGSLRVQDVREAWAKRVGEPDVVSADFETFLILLDDLEEYPEPPDDQPLDR